MNASRLFALILVLVLAAVFGGSDETKAGTKEIASAAGRQDRPHRDRGEPENDHMATPYYLGSLPQDGRLDTQWSDRLPGSGDVDVFSFRITGDSLPELMFEASPGDNPGFPFAMNIYHEATSMGTWAAVGPKEISGHLPARAGLWSVVVHPVDWVSSAPNPYNLRFWLGPLTAGVAAPSTSPSTAEIDVHVIAKTRLVWGSSLNAAGEAELLDAGRKQVWSRRIEAGKLWAETYGQGLAPGTYLLRLWTGRRLALEREVLIR